ncbi:unnamed protein product [Parnassius apollo]|uniref:(apollo) hypothetical protein n=1 Tax=Parnassius apollo TaxID=110799 RepID=A0A8S3WBT8_PARAO|nr:unnamed protein product [Parnassius apollo]
MPAFLQRNRRSQLMKTGKNSKLTVVPGKSISTEGTEEFDKVKKMKKDTRIIKRKEKTDFSLPRPSKLTSDKRNIKHAETKSLRSNYTYELDKDATLEDNSAQLHCSWLMLQNPDSLYMLCISATNFYLHPIVADSNNVLHYMQNLPKNSKFCVV